ncbi:MAG: hypothetical protein ACMVO5_04155 [Polymorphobacter sp.]|uniref:hypothetical protein n=1 Tax=Polymorphobacter sp. TaxID=1909290 RepID=UPI003A8634C7
MKTTILLALPLLLAGCASSPLYVDRGEARGTMAEIPRDANGEPLWAAIRPAPSLQPGEAPVMSAQRRATPRY